jgi:hypothetical protein
MQGQEFFISPTLLPLQWIRETFPPTINRFHPENNPPVLLSTEFNISEPLPTFRRTSSWHHSEVPRQFLVVIFVVIRSTCMAMSCLRHSVPRFAPYRPRFKPRSIGVVCGVNKLAPEQVCHSVAQFLRDNCHPIGVSDNMGGRQNRP